MKSVSLQNVSAVSKIVLLFTNFWLSICFLIRTLVEFDFPVNCQENWTGVLGGGAAHLLKPFVTGIYMSRQKFTANLYLAFSIFYSLFKNNNFFFKE